MSGGEYTSYDLAAELRETGLAGRIHNLTDAVFAIAMTLLMLNFKIPADLPTEHLHDILSGLAPEVFSYFLSFAVLGALWIGDYNHFRWIHRADRPFLWITVLFLSFVALLPASTAVLGRFYDNQLVVIAYSVHIFLCTAALYWQWWYASKHFRFLLPETTPDTVQRMKNRILVPMGLNVLGIALSFISPYITLGMFGVMLAFAIIPVTSDKIADSFDGVFFEKPRR